MLSPTVATIRLTLHVLAATIWLAGAVGVACAIDRYAIAAALTVLALFVLIVLGALTQRVHDETTPEPSEPAPEVAADARPPA